MAFEYASAGAQGYILKILGQHFGLPLQRVKEEERQNRPKEAPDNSAKEKQKAKQVTLTVTVT